MLVAAPGDVPVPADDALRVVGVVRETEDALGTAGVVDIEPPASRRAILAEELRTISDVEAGDSVDGTAPPTSAVTSTTDP